MPTFMIGTQRSGSNLLRLMLNQLPAIAAPHPPHIMERFAPLEPVYGDLADGANFAALVEDVCRMVEANPVPWEKVVLDRAEVIARCRDHSLVAVYGAVYDIMAAAWGARDWCCKSLANVNYLPEIIRYFPDARFIYLYRDGRDVALSFRKAIVGEKHYYFIANQWHSDQQLALRAREQVPAERFYALSYEALTNEAEATMRRLCSFLGVEYTDEVMNYNRSEEASRTAHSGSLWGNVTKPVMSGNSRKFLKEMSEEDIRIFESVAGTSLDALGYDRVQAKPGEELRFSEADLTRFAAENKRLKEAVKESLTPEELKLREPQQRLLDQIKARKAG